MSENIFTAVNEIMKSVGYVKKQRASGLNYTFAGETALIEALRPEMVENGIFCYVRDYHVISEEPYTTAKGTEMQNVRIKANIVFNHAPSGTEIVVCALGEGADTSDKATNKAMTGAYKYALRQTFCIETGDDPDKERVERAARQQPRRQAKQEPQPEADAEPEMAVTYPGWVRGVETSKGEAYIMLPTDKLSFMANSIRKAEAEGKGDHVEHERKLKAIEAILQARAEAQQPALM